MEPGTIISDLVGAAYPPAVELGRGRLRRTWIARTIGALPPDAKLVEIGQAVEREVFASIEVAYPDATAEALERVRPEVQLVRLDDNHVIVRTDFAGPDIGIGDADAIGQWGVLQRLDRELALEELQGIPCEHWFFLRAARAASST